MRNVKMNISLLAENQEKSLRTIENLIIRNYRFFNEIDRTLFKSCWFNSFFSFPSENKEKNETINPSLDLQP